VESFIAVIVMSVGLLTLSGASALVARASRERSLSSNGVIGIRTGATKSSEVAWNAGHDAARPFLIAGAITTASMALIVAAVAVFTLIDGRSQDLAVWIGLTSYAVALGVLLAATRAANAAARRSG
jgi:hypothetical protein